LKTKDFFHRLPQQARILLIRLRSMGDCLLLTGPVRALKNEFPGFRVSVLVEERFAPCFDGNPDFAHIIPSGTKGRTAAKLFTRYFNAIINLHGGPTSSVFACLAWGRRIGGEHHPHRRLCHGLYPAPAPEAHTVESTFAAFRWMGVHAEESPPLRYEIHTDEAARIQKSLAGRPYAVIHPAALMDTKRWAPDRFATVARRLQETGLRVVLTCGPGEESVVGEVAKDVPASTMMLGLNIPELAELLRGARLYVGNDSGPMHLAAAVGTPVVAVWGSSNSARWRPWHVEHRVVQNPFECNPCPGYRCLVANSPLCIESVTAEQVIGAVNDVLQTQNHAK
jgi:heptosyltransferase-3